MKIDALFDNVRVYDLQYRLDVIQGQAFTLIMDSAAGIDVYSNNDSVLQVNHSVTEIAIQALDYGDSKVRLMSGEIVIKELLIVVVDRVELPTADLGITVSVVPK